jgi:glycosyltransferase involved in cell wall biosynthesis
MKPPDARPELSVVVVCYECPRKSKGRFSRSFRHINATFPPANFEIILVDNGSAKLLDESTRRISPNLKYAYLSPDESSPSPAPAMNRGVAHAHAPLLCLMIDGARLLTPGCCPRECGC